MSTLPVHIEFLVNKPALKTINHMHEHLKLARIPTNISVRILDENWVIERSKDILFDHTTHHAGVWGAAKLFLPWLYPHLDRALVLDTDMAFSKDIALLWDLFEERNATTGEVNEHSWLWRMPLNSDHPWHVCTCVMLIEMSRIRRKLKIDHAFRNALLNYPAGPKSVGLWRANGSDFFHSDVGDQGVIFALFRQRPELFETLSQTWNSDHCHHYYYAFQRRVPRPQGILHRNCIGAHTEHTVDDASHFFNFFNNYPLNWHDGHHKVHWNIGKNITAHKIPA